MDDIREATSSTLPLPGSVPVPDTDPSGEYADDGRTSVVDLFAVVWKRRWLVVVPTLLAALLSVAFSIGSLSLPPDKSYLPNFYSPRAYMLISSSGGSGGLSGVLSSPGLAAIAGLSGIGMGSNANGALAAFLVKSNSVIDALDGRFGFSERFAGKPDAKTRGRALLLRTLSAGFDQKTNIFSVSFTHTDPVVARDVVNATVELLEARFAGLGGNRAFNQKNVLETKLREVELSISGLENEVRRFQSRYGVANVEALATEQVTMIARIRSELIMKEMEISNYRMLSRIDDPMIRKLEGERAILLAKIRELEDGKDSTNPDRIMPSQKELPKLAFEYAKLQRDLVVQSEVYKLLTQQYEVAKLNATGQEPVFQVLELAETLQRKSGPSRARLCATATAGTFGLFLFLAFLLEYADRLRNDPREIARFKALSARRRKIRRAS